MKKEVIIAVVAGLILGLIITMGIYTANRSISEQKNKPARQNQSLPSLAPNLANAKTLNLTSHENYDLVDQDDIVLAGVAWPKAVVALLTENGNQLAEADAEGIFSFNARLIKGFNEVTVIASDDTGSTQSQTIILTYSTNNIEMPKTNEAN